MDTPPNPTWEGLEEIANLKMSSVGDFTNFVRKLAEVVDFEEEVGGNPEYTTRKYSFTGQNGIIYTIQFIEGPTGINYYRIDAVKDPDVAFSLENKYVFVDLSSSSYLKNRNLTSGGFDSKPISGVDLSSFLKEVYDQIAR